MKEKNSALEAEGNGHPQKAARSEARRQKPGQAKADKVVAELERYRARVATNEERLRTGQAADGSPLTNLQRTNLEEITARQRAHLLDLSS
jgi:hypothetical protein